MEPNGSHSVSFGVRAAQPRDISALMQLKRLLAQGEDSLHALCATEDDWLRDGFSANAGFTCFVAETSDSGVGNSVVGMATCSQRTITGWNGPVVILQDLIVEPEYRDHGVARALTARVAAFAFDLGSPIVELTVRANNPAQNFYLRTGFQPVPQCLTYVLAGPALAALAKRDRLDFAPALPSATNGGGSGVGDQSSRGCQIISA
jgi:ribosomal protein S18 acetylase RimI-like enzyme